MNLYSSLMILQIINWRAHDNRVCNVAAKYHVMVMTKSWQDSWQVGKLVVGKLVVGKLVVGKLVSW